jgi:hypothetical protein
MKPLTTIVLLAAGLLVQVGSLGRADTTKSHFNVKGDTAVASFVAFDLDDSCIQHFVTVAASDLMEKVLPGGDPTSEGRTLLIVGQTDICLGITLFNGQGETLQHAFQFANDLGSATLEATVLVFHSVSFQTYDFDVDLTWTATGVLVSHHNKETLRDKELGLKIVTHLRGRHTPAVASGTVLGLGINFTPGPSDSAELQTENHGTIIIEHTR